MEYYTHYAPSKKTYVFYEEFIHEIEQIFVNIDDFNQKIIAYSIVNRFGDREIIKYAGSDLATFTIDEKSKTISKECYDLLLIYALEDEDEVRKFDKELAAIGVTISDDENADKEYFS